MPDRRHIHQHWSLLGAWYRLADALGIALALAIAVFRRPIGTIDHYAVAAAVAIIVYDLLAEMGGMYRSWRGVSAHREAMGALICWTCTAVTLLVLGFVTKRTAEFSRISMVTWFAVTPVLILAGRIATRSESAYLALVGLPHAGSSRSSASMSWDSSWRGTSSHRPRWGCPWRAFSTIGPSTATPIFPPTSAAAWERSRT